MSTVWVLLIMLVPLLGWEAYSLTQEGVMTISRAWSMMGQEWNLVFMYVGPLLIGHFFILPEKSLATYMSETGEVALVVWIGWMIFILSKGFPEWLPLSPAVTFVFICASVFIGGYCWTLHI